MKDGPTGCIIGLFTHHHRKHNGSLGGLDDPEQNQTAELDDGEQVHLPQGHVSQIDEVWLVLGWHTKQSQAVKELQRRNYYKWF